jgi:hypothetical protein
MAAAGPGRVDLRGELRRRTPGEEFEVYDEPFNIEGTCRQPNLDRVDVGRPSDQG